MKFLDFKLKFNKFVIFGLNDILLETPDFDSRRLAEWKEKGYLRIVRRGFYMFSDVSLNDQVLNLIANIIYHPSYVSLETAFSIYGLIPETVYAITSVGTKKTESFSTTLATFDYKHIKPALFFGYDLIEYSGRRYQIASVEKCVLDYLYLHPEALDQDFFSGLRFNSSEFLERADMEKFKKYLTAYNNKALDRRAEAFIKYLNI